LRWFPPVNWGNGVRWFAVLFSFGMCECVRRSMVDGPSLLLVAGGMALVESRKPWLAAAVFGVSGMGRETNLLSVASLAPERNTAAGWIKAIGQGLLILLPIAVWMLVLSRWIGGVGALDDTLGARNFAPPFAGYLARWGEVARAVAEKPGWIARGSVFIHVALTAQWLFLILRPRWSDPWWRLGAAYAFLMVILGPAVWEGYFGASARVLLPMTLAFNILVPRGRAWWIVLLLGNLTVLVSPEALNPPGRESFVVKGPRALRMVPLTGKIVEAVFDSHWHPQEKSWLEFWRWSDGPASLRLRNPHPFPVSANIAFVLRSNDRRSVRLIQGERVLWEGWLEPRAPHPVEVAGVSLAPGDTLWRLDTGPGLKSDNPEDSRILGFSLRNFTIELSDSGSK